MKISFLVCFGFLILSACGHSHRVKDNQEIAQAPSGVHVGIGEGEVVEGDRIDVFENHCRRVAKPRGTSREECTRKKVGEAVILKVLGHHSSIAEPQDGLEMKSSMLLKKKEGSKK